MAQPSRPQRRSQLDDARPEDDPPDIDLTSSEPPPAPTWTAEMVQSAYKEEKPPMATTPPEPTPPTATTSNPEVDIEDFHSARDLLGTVDGHKRSIFEPDPTEFERVASDIHAVVNAMVHSGDSINRINDTVSERIMKFTEKMLQDSTDAAYKDLVRLQHYGTVIVMAARGYLLAETLASLTLHKLQDLGADAEKLPKLPLQDFLYALQTLTMQRLKPPQGASGPASAAEVLNR